MLRSNLLSHAPTMLYVHVATRMTKNYVHHTWRRPNSDVGEFHHSIKFTYFVE